MIAEPLQIFTSINELVATLPDTAIYILRILIAAVCGGAIGTERSKRQKEAGIRTHLIVCLGAALMMIVSKYAFFDVVNNPDLKLQADVSRIASQVVTGISFLGAGVIFVKDTSIKGLTTAAGIWATAGIGLAVGGGMVLVGIVSTFLIIFLQVFLHKYAGGIEGAMNTYLKVSLRNNNSGAMERLLQVLDDHHIEVVNQKIRKKEHHLSVILSLRIPQNVRVENLSFLLEEDDDILSIEI